jgi:hypothetical protein
MTEEFTLADTDKFDARRGFTRWILPGTSANLPGHPQANADLWTSRDGRLFTRFSSVEYSYHYEISSTRQPVISEDRQDAVCEFLQEKLVTWMIEGIDDSVSDT